MEKEAKKLLKHISNKQNNPEGFLLLVDLFHQYEIIDVQSEQKMMAALRYLESQGYIHYINSIQSGKPIGIELEHKGHHQKAFKFNDFKKYLLANWIAFLALVISIVSFLRTF